MGPIFMTDSPQESELRGDLELTNFYRKSVGGTGPIFITDFPAETEIRDALGLTIFPRKSALEAGPIFIAEFSEISVAPKSRILPRNV